MTESPELYGEDQTDDDLSKRKRFVWILIPVVIVIGGIGIWITWPDSEEIVEMPEELEEIAAATAPPIIPQTSDSPIDVPAASEVLPEEDPALAGPTYIPPDQLDMPGTQVESLDVPIADPFQTTPHDEQRSRLQDALNASMVVEVKVIVDETANESESNTSTNEEPTERRYVLKPGTVIPSVLMQGINTDLPGIALAQVSRDVYDSKTGTWLLIPRGSRVFGRYGSEAVVSEERVLVTWERIDFPNGEVLELGEVIGADPSGNAGLKDQVHRGTARALTVTGLTSLITAGLAHATNANDPEVLRETSEGRFVEEPSYTSEATQEVARQYGEIVGQIAQRHLDRGTTLTIRPGYEFVIQFAEEVSLTPYLR